MFKVLPLSSILLISVQSLGALSSTGGFLAVIDAGHGGADTGADGDLPHTRDDSGR